MNSETTDNVKKMYYSIGEVADMNQIPTHRVRTICDEYGIEPLRRGNDKRYFTSAQAHEILLISTTQNLTRVQAVKAILAEKYPQTFKRFRVA